MVSRNVFSKEDVKFIAISTVQLGKSGLKVSRIILGTMQYGDPRWQPWVIGDEDEAIRHIKAAYEAQLFLIYPLN